MKRRPVVISRERSVVFTISEDRPPKSAVAAAVSGFTSSSNRSSKGSRSPHLAPTEDDQRLFFPEVVKMNLLQNGYKKKTMRLVPGVLQSWVNPWVRRIYLLYCQINGSAFLALWRYTIYCRHGNYAGGGSVYFCMSREFSLNDGQRFE